MSTKPWHRTEIGRSLLAASLFIAASTALAMLSPARISETLSHRLFGALAGLVVAVYANAIPKALTPLARMRCNPLGEQELQRFAGWSLVVGGVGYAIAWLVAPIDKAAYIAMGVLGAALLLVIVRYLRMRERAA